MEKKKKHYHRGRRKKKRSILSSLILIVAIGVFCFSGFQLFQIIKGYRDGEKEYDKIFAEVVSITNDKKGGSGTKFSVDFDKLRMMNTDTVGWIRFEQPEVINYPIVQTGDNDKYLYKTFQGYENTVGSIFVNCYNRSDFEDRNTIVYGHRMYNGTMFNKLGEYEDKSFWQKYPYFYIYKEDGTEMKYHIYSVGIINELSPIYNWVFEDDEEFQAFIDETKSSSFYDTGIEVDVDDKVVVLSTCTNVREEERLVVIGVREEVVAPAEE